MPRPADSLANWRALDAQLGPEVLRIASYNVHGCRGSDGKKDAQRIVRVIEECGCDTVGLQEVDYRLDYIAEKLGMTAIPGLTLARHDGPWGNALLTRRKILQIRRLGFTYSRREPRNALDVEIEVAGEPVRVIVTHLGLWPAERRYQVKQILKLIRETPTCERVVVLGDINEWLPLGRPIRWMHALFGRSPAERSFPSRWPLVALDRVWVRPRHALLALKAHRTSLAQRASDHLPVKAIVAVHQAESVQLRTKPAPADAAASSLAPCVPVASKGARTRPG